MKSQDRFELDPPQNTPGAKAQKKFENRNGFAARLEAVLFYGFAIILVIFAED